ncbi:MAG: peptidoglycan DD-metalloendopeptidase family protein [Gammaproteobacteria bacterium]|nr:peptidoglycan DD-metalloendopeptidase family protein [Gammaproteobacteria bacterium]
MIFPIANRLAQIAKWVRFPSRSRALVPGLLAALLYLAPGAVANTLKQERNQELDALRTSISQLQTRIEASRGQRDDMQGRLRETERRIGALTKRIYETQQQLKKSRGRLNTVTTQLDTQVDKLGGQRKTLGSQMRAAYSMGQQQYLKMLLNQEDPAAMGRVTTYYGYLNRARSKRIHAIKITLEKLASLKQEIHQRSQELKALGASQLKDKSTLEHSREARSNVVALLSKKVVNQSQEIDRLRRDEEYLVRLIDGLNLYMEELREDSTNTTRFDRYRGKLQLPAQAALRAHFGDPKQGGALTWEGLFLDAQEGQNVYAVFHGRVAFAEWFGGFGLLLIIDHGDGYMSLYGHNQALYAEVGDWVETGQLVSAVGNSGGLAQPGLYFEIRYKGVPRNPLLWVRPT